MRGRVLLLAILLLGMPALVAAQSQPTKRDYLLRNVTSAGDGTPVSGYRGMTIVTIQVYGTFTGTVTIKASLDGQTYDPLTCIAFDGLSGFIAITTPMSCHANLNADYLRADVTGPFTGSITVVALAAPTGSVTPTPNAFLPAVGTAGNYSYVTTDAQGRVTAGQLLSVLTGAGISGGGDLSETRTLSLNLASLVDNQTLWDGTQAGRTLTFGVTGTAPILSASSGTLNLSTGTLEQGGVPVVLTSRTITTSSPLSGGGTLASDLTLSMSSPSDATKYLNGAATPTFAAVRDSDLSTSDITTNDCSITKHGFTPKAPNDATKFLNGTCAWSVPSGGGGSPGGTTGQIQYNNAGSFGGLTAGGTCVNQFVRVLSGTLTLTCDTVSLTADITGTLATSHGGTGVTDLTFAGSTHQVHTATGTYTTGNCIKSDASGNLIDSGGACGSSTPGGTTGQIQYNNAGAFGGLTAGGTCTNQVVRVLSSTLTVTCATITSAYVDTSVWTGTATSGFLKASSQGVLTSVSAITLTTDVTGTLPAANGGTAVTDLSFAGSTHKVHTATGTYTTGNCIKSDASGNLIDSGGTCGGGGGGTPIAFDVTMSTNQTVASGGFSVANFDTISIDTGSYYDTTNHRYKPTSGSTVYVYVSCQLNFLSMAPNTAGYVAITKNGTGVLGSQNLVPTSADLYVSVDTVVALNGSTDYIDCQAGQFTGSNQIVDSTSVHSRFSGFIIH